MFRIKICGITDVSDAVTAANAGADAIGINFYAGSPRCVAFDTAKAIRDSVAGRVKCVGVFVNESAQHISWLVKHVGLDLVQLHGDEPATILAELPQIPVIKAFRLESPNLAHVSSFIREAGAATSTLAAVLLDAFRPHQFGGTGQMLDTARLAAQVACLAGFPWCLAGGLRPDNVAQAIREARPDAVDTSSGVERAPGRKDAHAVQEFIRAARRAFESIER
jgi:phosphoribosylanthranilate isomerase